ncbi:MAG: regulatory protein RecX [Solitalea-like symbiont of Acarus siro]
MFIIDYLIKEKFIDNKRYTREYIISKFKINKWGRSRIIVNLKKQNIDSSDIDKELALIDSSEYAETLKNILLKKKGALNNASKIEVRAKLLRYALYKGFEVDLINKELNEIIK